MPKSVALIAWILSSLLIVFVYVVRTPSLDANSGSSVVIRICAVALVLLVLPIIRVVRSKGRFGWALLLLIGLQALFCLNGIVAALGGYMW